MTSARTPFVRLLLVATLLEPLAGCNDVVTPAGSADPVWARVNGRAITEADLDFRLRNDSHRTEMRPEYRKNLLEAIIREEVLAGHATELGLDRDPQYQRGLRQLETQVAAFRRRRLTELLLSREVSRRSEVSEAEARRYFEAHAGELRTEVHLLQILQRSEAAIGRAQAALAAGKSFEEVAAGLSPEKAPPPGREHWDLGYARWQQIPAPWREAVTALKPGETSAVIKGLKDRFWILKLVDRRDNPGVTFESERVTLIDMLRRDRREETQAQLERELRDRARIEYLNPSPPPMPSRAPEAVGGAGAESSPRSP
ncbi:MAG: peptidyl-prolyl cis-trans isomerase [Deltaproteobacteria bacterium]|nr:peptidyl-prolyl cis-trans isomerase [Deltaproteobacteria bacterium]